MREKLSLVKSAKRESYNNGCQGRLRKNLKSPKSEREENLRKKSLGN